MFAAEKKTRPALRPVLSAIYLEDCSPCWGLIEVYIVDVILINEIFMLKKLVTSMSEADGGKLPYQSPVLSPEQAVCPLSLLASLSAADWVIDDLEDLGSIPAETT